MKMIFLDDLRIPSDIYSTGDWVVIRSYAEFVEYATENHAEIDLISFDHDLGTDKTGYDAVCFVEYLVREGKFPNCETFLAHSANPSGRAKIINAIRSIAEYQRTQ